MKLPQPQNGRKALSEENINVGLHSISDFFKTGISVDCVIFGYDDKDLRVLVTQCNMDPYKGKWSLLGDLVYPDEDLEVAAARVLFHRTGISNLYVEQVGAFGRPGRHPIGRVITVLYFALIKVKDYEVHSDPDHTLAWKCLDELDEMAFDHRDLLEICLKRLRETVLERPIIFNLLPRYFTLTQLQAVYEAILGKQFEKRNFRKKLFNLGLLERTDRIQKDVAHRPARLYRLNRQLENEQTAIA